MSPESHDEHGNEDDRRPSGTRGSDTDCWLEKATVSQNRLVAHFKPDGTYVLREHVASDVLASDAITLAHQGDPQLTTAQWAELHRVLAARAPCYAAASYEDRERIVALTRLDVDSALVRHDEEELHFRRFLETGDFYSY